MVFKTYSLGTHGRVPPAVAAALGLIANRTQADVIVTAKSKHAAFDALLRRRMAPSSLSAPEFRVDTSQTVDQLRAALAAGVQAGDVIAMQLTSSNTPVVRIHEDGTFTLVGEFVRGQFIPARGEPIVVQTADYPEEAEMVLTQLVGVDRRVDELARAMNETWAERRRLCARAVALGIVEQAAAELKTTIDEIRTEARRLS